MVSFLGFVLAELFVTYSNYPFKTVWTVRRQTHIPVPGITFCLPSNIDMKKVEKTPWLHDYLSKTRSIVDFENAFSDEKEMNRYLDNTKLLLNNITVTEFINSAGYKENHVIVYKQSSSDKKITFKEVTDLHKACWVLSSNKTSGFETMTSSDRIVLMFDVNSDGFPPAILHTGLEVFVHESHSSREPKTQEPLYIRPGSRAVLQFTRTEHIYLPLPYKSFGEDTCMDVEHEDFINPFKLFGDKYSKQNCIMENLIRELVIQCNCTIPYAKEFFPHMSECTMMQSEFCFAKKAGYYAWFAETDKRRAAELGCFPECSSASYDVTISTANFPSKNAVHFFKVGNIDVDLEYARENLILLSIKPIGEIIKVVKQEPEITILSIFASVGGYMGLLLGASLLTVSEVLEAVILSLLIVISKIRVTLSRENK